MHDRTCSPPRHAPTDTAGRTPAKAPRLRASWRRSEHYGVSAEQVEPAFTGSVDTDSLLYECGNEVLRGIQRTIANEPVSLMITDSEGLVLSRLANDAAILRSLDRVHLAPGFSYAERDAGTNGLGLALADRAPSLVRAEEHYCTGLRGYTCAAAPVLDPSDGTLVGSVNLTTWSESSSALLLALAQSAAQSTAALMLARGAGRRVQPAPRGAVFRFRAAGGGGQADACASRLWRGAVAEAREAVGGRTLAVVGEPGSGRTSLASLARRQVSARERVLNARPPAPEDVDSWLTLWTPELAKDDTCVIVSGVEALPAWGASELARLLAGARRGGGRPQPFVVTGRSFDALPEALRELVDAVVEAPALRRRPEDVLPLARHFAQGARGRAIGFTPAASRALTDYHWPGNVTELKRAVCDAALRADVVDVHHLPAEVFRSNGGRRLSRIQAMERDEIVRCLTAPGATVVGAAAELGMGRATVYRKMRQYNIRMPHQQE